MADRAGLKRDLHLPRPWRAQGQGLNPQRFPEGIADGGADFCHGASPLPGWFAPTFRPWAARCKREYAKGCAYSPEAIRPSRSASTSGAEKNGLCEVGRLVTHPLGKPSAIVA